MVCNLHTAVGKLISCFADYFLNARTVSCKFQIHLSFKRTIHLQKKDGCMFLYNYKLPVMKQHALCPTIHVYLKGTERPGSRTWCSVWFCSNLDICCALCIPSTLYALPCFTSASFEHQEDKRRKLKEQKALIWALLHRNVSFWTLITRTHLRLCPFPYPQASSINYIFCRKLCHNSNNPLPNYNCSLTIILRKNKTRKS